MKVIKVYTIEEYLRVMERQKLGENFIIEFCNPEVAIFGRNYSIENNKKILVKKQGFVKSGDNYAYNLDSKFNFGKHKGNELKYVFKCDPYYLEWCMLNASGFLISDETLNLLIAEKVFNVDDLFKFAKMVDENTLEINLTSFQLNSKNLPYSNEVREEFFSFSKEAIEANNRKSKSKMDTKDLFKGGNWENRSFIQDNRLSRKSIVIKK